MWGLFSLSLYAFTLSYLSIVVRQYPTVFPTFEWYSYLPFVVCLCTFTFQWMS